MNDISVDIDNPDCYGEINIPIELKDEKNTMSEITVRWSRIPNLFAVNPEGSG